MRKIILFQKRVGDPLHKRWEDCVVPSEVRTVKGIEDEMLRLKAEGNYRAIYVEENEVVVQSFAVETFTDCRVVPSPLKDR